MSYSFEEYHNETDFTRNNETCHNTLGYGMLGLIGELGEVIESVNLPENCNSVEECEAVGLLREFVSLANKIESTKKSIRKKQLRVLVDVDIPQDKATEELGGVYWYLNNLAFLLGLSMSDIAKSNKNLLEQRFQANPRWMTNDGVKVKSLSESAG